MKTAEEILTKWYKPLHGIGDIAELQIVEAMKEFALEACKEALRSASENAITKMRQDERSGDYNWVTFIVDKQSVLSEDNIPEEVRE